MSPEARGYIAHSGTDSEAIFDVDDGPMMRKRELVMNVCVVQVLLSFAMLANARRSPALAVLQPFFLAAGVLGYLGARRCNALMVAAHFLGSAGLSLVFMIFILAEAFLQQSNKDLLFFVLNFPMDLFLLTTSGASVVLWLALTRLRRQLRIRRQQVREQFQAQGRGDDGSRIRGSPDASQRDGPIFAGGPPNEVPLSAADRAQRSLTSDLLCPITLETMRDPVIAGDGHSYEVGTRVRVLDVCAREGRSTGMRVRVCACACVCGRRARARADGRAGGRALLALLAPHTAPRVSRPISRPDAIPRIAPAESRHPRVVCAQRDAIERWLRNHRTSPLTGRALPHSNVIANHRCAHCGPRPCVHPTAAPARTHPLARAPLPSLPCQPRSGPQPCAMAARRLRALIEDLNSHQLVHQPDLARPIDQGAPPAGPPAVPMMVEAMDQLESLPREAVQRPPLAAQDGVAAAPPAAWPEIELPAISVLPAAAPAEHVSRDDGL